MTLYGLWVTTTTTAKLVQDLCIFLTHENFFGVVPIFVELFLLLFVRNREGWYRNLMRKQSTIASQNSIKKPFGAEKFRKMVSGKSRAEPQCRGQSNMKTISNTLQTTRQKMIDCKLLWPNRVHVFSFR